MTVDKALKSERNSRAEDAEVDTFDHGELQQAVYHTQNELDLGGRSRDDYSQAMSEKTYQLFEGLTQGRNPQFDQQQERFLVYQMKVII